MSNPLGAASRLRTHRRWLVAVALAWALAALAGCTDPPPRPVIVDFTAAPAEVGPGGTATLSWTVTDATSLRLLPGNVDVSALTSFAVTPAATTTYTLTASNGATSVSANATVVVAQPPSISSFSATPAAVTPGAVATLQWSVTGASSLRLLPDDIDVSGQSNYPVTPDTTTTYVLAAGNDFGDAEAEVTVPVGPAPVIVLFETTRQPVNPGQSNTLTWTVTDADTIELRGPGLGDGIDVGTTTTRTVTDLPPGATYTLTATNTYGTTEAEATASRAIPAITLLITGQSNAVGVNLPPLDALTYITANDNVTMLGGDYLWKPAYEPLFDCTNQIDEVNRNPPIPEPCNTLADTEAGVSPGVSAGNHLNDATNAEIFLIPAALSGSRADVWLPTFNRYDRDTLFGSATFRGSRADVQQGAPPDAIIWYQGESNTTNLTRTTEYAAYVPTILDTWRDELNTTTLIVQLSRRGPVPGDEDATARNLLYQIVREHQRTMATGAQLPSGTNSSAALQRTHLIVTHDLPMAEGRHLSAAGQTELGRRISLAIQQHHLGEAVDGEGPRLVRIDKPNNTTIRILTDRPITPPTTTGPEAYANYFAAFANGTQLDITTIERDPSDTRAIRITLATPITGTVQIRYMPPPGTPTTITPDVIRTATCTNPTPSTNLCLPMAAFGSEVDTLTMNTLQTYTAEEDPEFDGPTTR